MVIPFFEPWRKEIYKCICNQNHLPIICAKHLNAQKFVGIAPSRRIFFTFGKSQKLALLNKSKPAEQALASEHVPSQ
ncbi:hypothetical protein COT48_01470 [Candidatus Woesearchaeota archaeon CG08_land_8_20_14_0_20_47_9]|nr:MAG: hypothetical protein AUJ69_01695 [Candidatus Woesearchaeota archaeon CG1_02_47_18]PIO04242.1 MAG: hypothetical protein COT48_01470 [Candidatus Woesearchaeota archaeon CG08_land_8_20_14_0_20_47_9]